MNLRWMFFLVSRGGTAIQQLELPSLNFEMKNVGLHIVTLKAGAAQQIT